jgi:hypothetical protein
MHGLKEPLQTFEAFFAFDPKQIVFASKDKADKRR